MERFIGLIEQIPEQRKMIFIESGFDCLSVKEIVDEMGISPKIVENQITHDMKYMKSKWNNVQIGTKD